MLDMGLGKTRLSLELLRYWFKVGQVHRAVVVVPTNEVSDTWDEQIKLWAPELPYLILKEGSSKAKLLEYTSFERGIVVVVYPTLAWMASELKKADPKKDGTARRTQKGKLKREVVPVRKNVKLLRSDVQALILDEITKVSHRDSVQFRVCRQLSRHSQIHYGLAGRPFGRDPLLLWAQFYLLDHGKTLGPTLGFFREIFFKAKKRYWGGPHSFDYTFDPRMEKDLHRIMMHRSIRYSENECSDLPAIKYMRCWVDFPEEPQAYYQRMVKQMIAARGDMRAVESIFLRMRQLSSGFLGFKNDETGEKAQVAFDENPKLDALMELLAEMPKDRKAVIVHEFTHSGRMICAALTKARIKHGWVWGGTKDSKPIKERFNNDPTFNVIVGNWKKIAYGVDQLQCANYMFIYESPVSVIDREQLEHRLKRKGQKRRVFVYDLLTQGSKDATILAFHKEGEDLFRALVGDPARILAA